jgi:tetratricopeptide (TPR) repeat protein
MSKISIKEQKNQSQTTGFPVVISFDDSDEFDGLTVQDPLTPQNKAKLEWHFEHYVSYPYLNTVEPQEASEIIRQAGENLFSQLFSQPHIYNRYQQILQQDLQNLVIEISGSPEFHSLHWEALKDANLSSPLALDSLILRKDSRPQNLPADVRETTTINLLIVTSRPAGRRDVGYRTISRPLVELLRNSSLPVRVHILRPATYESLSKHLAEVGKSFYQVVHFDVHGALLTYENFELIEKEKASNNLTFQIERYGRPEIQPYTGKDAFLFFDVYREPESRDDDGFRADPVRADEMANLLVRHGVPLVILNACQSAKELGEQGQQGTLPIAEETSLASRLMRAGAQTVLAMSYSVTVTAAEILMKSLYQEIFRGKTLHQAIQIGRRELASRKLRRAAFNRQISLEDWLLPVVYQKQKVELKTTKPTPQEEEELLLAREEIGRMPEVEYGFYGRDIDILNIERSVLLKNNILLIRGMGGAGKTTLLKHLAWWWRATDFIRKVFYFGYDEKAYTRQQIMREIAKILYDRFEFASFKEMDEKAQMQKLAGKLRTECHLLILDNLESIQGGFFAVKNTLSPAEQAKLKDFLAELRGSDEHFKEHKVVEQTIVLLGSRSAEEWLADKTFRKNLYDLGGLDRESATQFAEEILRQNEILQYRNEEDFKKLLKLLAGFPLPMKVIFENLKRQNPTQVLDALKAGDVDLNTGTAEEKTADILKCIEYSHSNIAPEKQELLLCLAPFTSVVNRIYFEHYIEELKKHEALAHLQHELWDEVFAESTGRGLMSQQEDLPYLNLQPILPYFLKTEWQKSERSDFKQAVQTAFRDYYDGVSGLIYQLMRSKEANERMLGQFLANLEFENMDTCLEYSLAAQTSIQNPYFSLSAFYDALQNHQAGLDLGTKVLERMKGYPPEILAGAIGLEFVGVLDDTARRQLLMKKYVEAENSYQKALEALFTIKSLDDKQKKQHSARILHQLGYVAQEQREFEKAEDYYKQALEIYNEFNERYELADSLGQLGLLKQTQREFEKAEGYFQQALEIHIEFHDLYSQAKTFHNLGTVAQEQREFEKAEDYYKQALEIKIKFNDRYLQASTLHQLGSVAEAQLELEKADDYYKQALEIYIEFNDRYSQASSLGQLGLLKQEQTKFVEAQSYLLQALEIFRDFNDEYSLILVFSNLRNLWKKSGNDNLLVKVGEVLGWSDAEVRELFEREDSDESEDEEADTE